MKMGKIELLAPAGSFESLIAAVQNGADAVYFGTGSFNARASAANFKGEELQRALDYCHARGVDAHITMNTLLLDREFGRALEVAAELYRLGADALIVQDIGLIAALRRCFPDLPIHASTQMTVHNAEGVRACARMGLSRAVLAREVSLEEIRQIRAQSSLPLETFVHGAMCVSVSGQCLMSSFLGGRSGNRGGCAQPCRMPCKLGEASGYLLSMKDLCMLEHLEELQLCGVASLKIEGQDEAAGIRGYCGLRLPQGARWGGVGLCTRKSAPSCRCSTGEVFPQGTITEGMGWSQRRSRPLGNAGGQGCQGGPAPPGPS